MMTENSSDTAHIHKGRKHSYKQGYPLYRNG